MKAIEVTLDRRRFILIWSFVAAFLLSVNGHLLWAAPIKFSRDILPIFSDNCFTCHGPDQNHRQADLRLDTQEGALRTENRVIVPGDAVASELVLRLISSDSTEVMPPPKTNRHLTAEQIELIKRWINEGAKWGKHWAYESPLRPGIPAVAAVHWPKNSIDRFVLARLEQVGLAPSAEASRETLIRRVTLDLTGLPPKPEEVAAFVQDRSDGAYEAVVDRLLASPRYGERMAWEWLDAARYADTNGYQGDPTRSMWYWRDWVIDALNRNLPFDQFTIEQLAGDLLPSPTREQLIATGFHRNHMINGEGGRIAEESRVDYVQDRVETTGTVWMGMTFNCCRCHDHKFDPLSQREYYQLAAYFNSFDESGGTDAYPQARPILPIPTREQEMRIQELKSEEEKSRQSLAELESRLKSEQAAWEAKWVASGFSALAAEWKPLVPVNLESSQGATLTKSDEGILQAGGADPERDSYTLTFPLPSFAVTGFKLDALPDSTLPNQGPGRAENGNFVLTEFSVEVQGKPVRLSAIQADYEQGGFPLANAFDGNRETGWAVASELGKPHSAMIEVVDFPGAEVKDGTLIVRLEFNSSHKNHTLGKFRLWMTSSPANAIRPLSEATREALATTADKRNEAQRQIVSSFYLGGIPEYVAKKKLAEGARQAREGAEKGVATTMIVRDLEKFRDTFVLERGAYDKPREKVNHGVPALFPPLPESAPTNRLALARWLVSPEHPLTARVTVNRYWQMFFGTGLVKTAEDFGVQGEKPSHPDLLDWLAREFVETGWNVKSIHRMIVTSAAYRQSSTLLPGSAERDPENRLLARGPRHRLPSWMIRDQALAAGGLLVEKIGGRGVRGYQPAGIWEEATFGQIRYEQEHGDALYRRSLYVFWRRIVGPTMFFDVANRQTCAVKVARTNTPLHALATLNDVTYVEAARGLAQRVLTSSAISDQERIADAFRIVVSRNPKPAEIDLLARRLAALRENFAMHADQAERLIGVGESKPKVELSQVELASWTGLSTILLNLDEWLSKE